MKDHGGAIVNISSLAARCPTAGRSTLYGPMKAAIVNLTQTLAGEYAAYGVRVCCVMPGFTATPAVKATIPPEELAYNAAGTLLNRGGGAFRDRGSRGVPLRKGRFLYDRHHHRGIRRQECDLKPHLLLGREGKEGAGIGQGRRGLTV